MRGFQHFISSFLPFSGAVLLVVSAAWSIEQFREGTASAAETSKASGKRSWSLAGKEAQTLPEMWMRRARVASDEVFPPDRTRAVEAYEQALFHDPMNAVAWYELARELALLGETRRAAAALRRSDALDPQNVKARLGAIQLWDAVGERGQAVALARQTAAHGGRHLEDAARRLVDLGMAPAEVYDELKFDALTPDDQARFLGALHVNDAEAMRRLVGKLDFTEVTRAESRECLARLVSGPALYTEAVELWRLQMKGEETFGEEIPRVNLSLERSPFREPFLFGWQAIEDEGGTQVRWIAPNPDGLPPEGRIQIRRTEGGKNFRKVIYRTPARAGQGLRFILNVRSYPAEAPESYLQLVLDGAVVDWARLLSGAPGWQRLKVELPPLDADVLCELMFEIRADEGRIRRPGPVEINLGRLEIESVKGVAPFKGGGPDADLQG